MPIGNSVSIVKTDFLTPSDDSSHQNAGKGHLRSVLVASK